MSLFIGPNSIVGHDDQLVQDDILQYLLESEPRENDRIQEVLSGEIPERVLNFIQANGGVNADSCIAALKTSTSFNVDNFPDCQKSNSGYDLMVNLKALNDTPKINRLFLSFNRKLKPGGVYIGCVETYNLRKKRLLQKYPPVLNLVYYFFDYIFKRVFPKIKYLDKFYVFVTAGRNKAISETEALGRLSYCGFNILDTRVEGNLMYFAAAKAELPDGDLQEKNYRILLRLPRRGKNGKIIHVLKLRTMFPYAEFIQNYVYEKNELKEGGKFNNDFRISLVGRFFRKYFLDEIPMILNLFKGELKLVGVRPISEQYFNLYGEKLQSLRMKHKPGLIPPYYADLPKTIQEIEDSEIRYLKAYENSPLKTDVKYLYLAFKNIFIKKARSN